MAADLALAGLTEEKVDIYPQPKEFINRFIFWVWLKIHFFPKYANDVRILNMPVVLSSSWTIAPFIRSRLRRFMRRAWDYSLSPHGA
jgi:hypothetical protein